MTYSQIKSCSAGIYGVGRKSLPDRIRALPVNLLLPLLLFLCPMPVWAQESEMPEMADRSCALSLRTNMLRWATLTPDLGVEWHIDRNWSILVNGSWTSWSWQGKERRYALWNVMPEARCYFGQEKRGYAGVMLEVGEFNYKLSIIGKQGDLLGGGVTCGYLFSLGKHFDLDFHAAVGYLHADYDRYVVRDGVRVRRSSEIKNWWGPVNLGVSLIWNLL